VHVQPVGQDVAAKGVPEGVSVAVSVADWAGCGVPAAGAVAVSDGIAVAVDGVLVALPTGAAEALGDGDGVAVDRDVGVALGEAWLLAAGAAVKVGVGVAAEAGSAGSMAADTSPSDTANLSNARDTRRVDTGSSSKVRQRLGGKRDCSRGWHSTQRLLACLAGPFHSCHFALACSI
jgi:hypothetical protein